MVWKHCEYEPCKLTMISTCKNYMNRIQSNSGPQPLRLGGLTGEGEWNWAAGAAGWHAHAA